ncbi:radical SAM protein [Candidatus Poribacteria bacterium]|nr:radical SAM protein [Candidatus Poribacteria bacterium]
MKILLISTDVDWDVTSFDEILKLPFVKEKAYITPLALATIAALTPDDIEVDLWDERVRGWIDDSTVFEQDYDLVGFTGYSRHLPRARQIAQIFRKRGVPVAIGGAGVTSAPEACREFFDIVFIGEAELTWPRFMADWKAGAYQREYRQITKPDLTLSPIPRWDSIANDMNSYLVGAVQTARGCPFDCEFCDVAYLYGHRPRHKPIDKVLEEVRVLEQLGMQTVSFCDDNFIGNPRYTKELLRELIPLNQSFRNPMNFYTELSINVAKDDELLEMLADANFGLITIGIETPNKESLLETNKLHNYSADLISDISKIQSYGMAIRAAMIVGFDHDDKTIFDQHFEFLQEASIPLIATHILRAEIGTKLWRRLSQEGRIVLDEEHEIYANHQGANTNIIPARMTRVELFSGYLNMVEKLSEWRNFEKRVTGFLSGIKREPNISQKKEANQAQVSPEVLKYLLFSVDEEARDAIFRIIQHTRRHAPFMRQTVMGIIVRQLARVAMLRGVRKSLRERIELESSEVFKLDIDQPDILLPEKVEAGREMLKAIE